MAAPIKPSKKVAIGRTTWWAVPTIASLAAPTVAEVNSASGLNITCFLLGNQDGLSADTGKVELERLLCETTTTESLDATKFTIPDFRFVWDPQAGASANDKKAWALLKDGFTGFLVRRQNVISGTDSAVSAAQFVDAAPVIGSIGVPKESATDASGIYVFDITWGITGTPSINVAVAA